MQAGIEAFQKLTLATTSAMIALRDYLAEWEFAMHRAYMLAGEPYGPSRKGFLRWVREQMEAK